jgi:hypothetical protein
MPQLPLKGKEVTPQPVSSAETVARVRRMIESRLDDIAAVLLDAAADGDVGAGRLLIERTMAPAKSSPIKKPVKLRGTLEQQVSQVKNLLAAGELSLDEAEMLLRSIESQQRIKVAEARIGKDIAEFRRSEEFWRVLIEEIRAESSACSERIMRRLARLQRDRGLPVVGEVIDVSAEPVPAPLPAPNGGDDDAF